MPVSTWTDAGKFFSKLQSPTDEHFRSLEEAKRFCATSRFIPAPQAGTPRHRLDQRRFASTTVTSGTWIVTIFSTKNIDRLRK
jgi:hypothetical protein